MRRGVAAVLTGVALAATFTLTGCADDAVDPCAALAEPLPALDGEDDGARWRAIADTLAGDAADSARALAVVAEQVAALGPDATLEDQAAMALRPAVAEHLAVVTAYRSAMCGR